ncbi:unnamed protein product [Spirodela intermedia]|uniref:PDZ domain-containing protein n=1 Tax=Spirodela intermedia TaxID=51605 RepID=A0A7I8J278_SPIIN|nr:unnamed protein product [Spirodela intermedia]CAA6663481.1 unnamed protein product [Spirodela intermedia]
MYAAVYFHISHFYFYKNGKYCCLCQVYCTHTSPDYSLPWQKQRQFTSTGRHATSSSLLSNYYIFPDFFFSLLMRYRRWLLVRLMLMDCTNINVTWLSSAFMIGDGKLLTNAHCVEHYTQVKVKKRGDDTKFPAKVLARGVECDLALLSVDSEEFWKDVEPLRFGRLPCLQDSVTVVGYPLGGDTISVTKGVVSRIEVTSYAHGTSDLLGIQIDAAINPGNSGGPAFNDQGECIGVAFQVLRSDEAENIGYVIPTTVVSHFLNDYERNGKYTGFPCLGVLLQKLENPALRACLKVQSNEGVLVRRVEPTSAANNILKEGDVIVSFDGVQIGCEGTVPFRSTERIAFRYLIKMIFFQLKLLAKARYSLAKFEGEEIVILSQVILLRLMPFNLFLSLANEVNIGYMGNQLVLKFNGTRIKNIRHLAHLLDSKSQYNFLVVLEREAAANSSSCILKDYGIPSERSADLLEPYVESTDEEQAAEVDIGEVPVSNLEIGFDGLLWA